MHGHLKPAIFSYSTVEPEHFFPQRGFLGGQKNPIFRYSNPSGHDLFFSRIFTDIPVIIEIRKLYRLKLIFLPNTGIFVQGHSKPAIFSYSSIEIEKKFSQGGFLEG